jgi:hypothetical protein
LQGLTKLMDFIWLCSALFKVFIESKSLNLESIM